MVQLMRKNLKLEDRFPGLVVYPLQWKTDVRKRGRNPWVPTRYALSHVEDMKSTFYLFLSALTENLTNGGESCTRKETLAQ